MPWLVYRKHYYAPRIHNIDLNTRNHLPATRATRLENQTGRLPSQVASKLHSNSLQQTAFLLFEFWTVHKMGHNDVLLLLNRGSLSMLNWGSNVVILSSMSSAFISFSMPFSSPTCMYCPPSGMVQISQERRDLSNVLASSGTLCKNIPKFQKTSDS